MTHRPGPGAFPIANDVGGGNDGHHRKLRLLWYPRDTEGRRLVPRLAHGLRIGLRPVLCREGSPLDRRGAWRAPGESVRRVVLPRRRTRRPVLAPGVRRPRTESVYE